MRGLIYIVVCIAVVAAAVVGVRQYTASASRLLPDMVPLPARDLHVATTTKGTTEFFFSTTHYNRGAGPLEVRFDQEVPLRGDTERPVMQRIFSVDGAYTDKMVGTFMWHEEHKHYHFADYVMYKLERLSPEPEVLVDDIKSTFCLRDVTRVLLELPNRSEGGEYKTCNSEVQGASIGWGETYYYDYPGQSFDVSTKPAGTYRLTTTINPDKYLDESDYSNNTASVTFDLDPVAMTITNIVEVPGDAPEVEHVRLLLPFGINNPEHQPTSSPHTSD